MGSVYVRNRGDRDWRTGVPRDACCGIHLTDTTSGVALFIGHGEEYQTIRLSPSEARKLSAELLEVADEVEESNR